uniref:NADH-ubiquinone oxidoreductase chain 4L n=1 Tax=Metallus mai TaxID=2782261 RepID=A0A7T6C1Z8_9HYME|nr:NADH dehydrogenase subunit 4L [Metallus mai]
MMLNNLIYMIFFMGFFNLCLNRKYLLMILLTLEFMVLLIYFQMMIFLSMFEMELFFSMFFLVFSVCEGVLGLSILVLMVRMNGNDFFQILSIL